MWLAIALLALSGGIVWLSRSHNRPRTDREDRDTEVLEGAEAEVRDLDALATPEDATDDLPDWGPGTPR